MPELSEGQYRERRFARSHGLIPANFKLNSSRRAYKEAFRYGTTTRVSGIDVRRAGGNVLAARNRREITGAKPRRTVAAGGSKPTRTAKARFRQIGRRLARGR